jgi:serine protease Do
MAGNVMAQLIEHGEMRRAMLGVTVQPVTADIAASLKLPEIRGALVNSVQPGSAAEKAGIRRGDVILEIDGTVVNDGNSVRNQVAGLQPGTRAALTVTLADGTGLIRSSI